MKAWLFFFFLTFLTSSNPSPSGNITSQIIKSKLFFSIVTQASDNVETLFTEIFELLRALDITFLNEKSSSISKILFSILHYYNGNLI